MVLLEIAEMYEELSRLLNDIHLAGNGLTLSLFDIHSADKCLNLPLFDIQWNDVKCLIGKQFENQSS